MTILTKVISKLGVGYALLCSALPFCFELDVVVLIRVPSLRYPSAPIIGWSRPAFVDGFPHSITNASRKGTPDPSNFVLHDMLS